MSRVNWNTPIAKAILRASPTVIWLAQSHREVRGPCPTRHQGNSSEMKSKPVDRRSLFKNLAGNHSLRRPRPEPENPSFCAYSFKNSQQGVARQPPQRHYSAGPYHRPHRQLGLVISLKPWPFTFSWPLQGQIFWAVNAVGSGPCTVTPKPHLLQLLLVSWAPGQAG